MITPKIQTLYRSQIDDTKWNAAIQQAANSLPYAYTWYLDALCPRWMALVIGDYDFVMPLPIDRKWGMRYAYQPLFCQQLGIFYKHKSETVIAQMLNAALKKFIFLNLNINYDNGLKTAMKGLTGRKNLIISLNEPHAAIQKKYNENTKRNIKKAVNAGLVFEEAGKSGFAAMVDFYISGTAMKDATFKPKNAELLKRLAEQFVIRGCGRMFIAKTPQEEICAGVIIVENKNRIIHLIPAGNDLARRTGGMHFVVDGILNHYAGSGRHYDFEGSSIPSIAHFYEGFGAVDEPFFMLHKFLFKAPEKGG